MRRKLLSVALCVCMMFTMVPFAFATGDTESNTEGTGTTAPANPSGGAGGSGSSTENGITSENALESAISSAANGATVKLDSNIVLTKTIVVDKNITLDMDGHTLSNTQDIWNESGKSPNWSFISVQNNGDLTITGNGTFQTKANDCYAVDIQDATAKCTIENGTFVGNIHAIYVFEGSLFVNGGTYSIQQKYTNANQADEFVLNCYDANRRNGSATISVSGGSFVNFDPANCQAEGMGTNFCADGYTTTSRTNDEDTIYTVSSGTNSSVANAGANYNTLQSAINSASEDFSQTVTLLKDVTEKVVVPAGKTITLDLNGNKIQAPTNGRYDAIDNSGTLTVKDSKKTGEIVSKKNSGIGVYANSNTTIDYAKITGQEGAVGGFETTVGATITINDGEFKGIDNAVVIFNGSDRHGASNEITINGGTFTGTIQTDGYVACGIYAPWNDNITVNDGIFNITGGAGIVARAGNVTVKGGEFRTTGSAVGKVGDSRIVVPCSPLVFDSEANYPALTADSKITVTGGKFTSESGIAAICAKSGDSAKRIVISGGYFNKEFSNDFCATGLTVIGNNDDTYKYTVGTIEAKGDNEIKTDTKAGTTQAAVSNEINEENQTAAQAAGASVKPTTLTDSTPITETDKNQALTELVKNNKINLVNGEIPAGTTVTVVKEIYLDVTVTAYDTENNTVSMNIVPKYNLIAVANNDSGNQKVTLKSAQDTTVSSATVTVKIPAFADKKVYINHADKNLYVATAQTDGTIEFTTNGFSPFTFSLSNSDVVAEVNGNAYKSLQEAADATKDGEEITVVKNDKLDLNFTATKSVKVTNKTSDKITVKFNGVNRDVAKDATETFSYTRPSSGSGSTSYAVNVNAATNGAVAADKKTAAKGTTVTVTASPSKGYVVDAVKVVDKDGKDVAVTEKDGKYVFTMPASAVTVTGSFKAETPAPVALPFTDVKSGNWFYDAVKYAYAQGLMTGTSATTFAPNGTMNRAMIVTVLYRLEKSPAVTGASKFTDVPAGQWYSDAVAWAAANKIVNGYDETTFGPMNAVTREQMAAILFRYEQVKGLENVTLEENLNRFPDQNKISAYAIPALQWAVGQKIINGNADGTLDPTGTATRAQVAQIFTNLLNK